MSLIRLFLIGISILVVNAQRYRLPGDVRPEQYYLDIRSYLGEKDNFNFDGHVTIEVSCLRPTANITLHSKGLEINEKETSVKDISSSEKTVPVSGVKYDKDDDFIFIVLSEPLVADHKYKVGLSFKGKMNDGLAGFYRSSYKDAKSGEKKWLGVTQFEPVSARRAFPCFDEPAMKARFQIKIGRKAGYSSISNMPLAKTEPMDKEGWFWDHFENSVPMSTYLVAFIVSDFGYKTAEGTKSNVTFNIWARKDALSQVDFARDVGPKALEFYENFFDIRYPLPKQDMVAVPDFSAGAMENWGLITYREAYLLYDPLVSSTTSQHSVASVIAHELAHQWFGNLVTMTWWTDLWLNEGFATYMAGLATDHLFPRWNSLTEESAADLLRVFSFDSLVSSHPVSVPIGHPDEIDEIFDTISYKKGSFLIRMMSLFLGEEILRLGVSDYLKKHKYGNAEQDDLWAALTIRAQQAGILPKDLTLKTVMDSWTVQTGYPVVHVKRLYGQKKAELTQRRFLRDVAAVKSNSECWWIPLSYTTEKEANFNSTIARKWMPCPVEAVTIDNTGEDNEWLIVNIRSAGLFRVNYDEENWKLILTKLKSESYKDIPTLNRVQLIDDTFDIATTGDLKYDTFFDLIGYLKYEKEFVPWKAALANIGYLKKELRFSTSYGCFKNFARKLLAPAYEEQGGFIIKKASADRLDTVKHQIMITSHSCVFEVGSCIEDAKNLFAQWKNSRSIDQNSIPKDLRGVVYCNSIRKGNQEDWEFLWKQYLKSNVATEKNTMLSSLGCTKELWLLSRYLEWSLDENSGIRRQDMSSVFASVAANEFGFFVAKDWLYKNFKRIRDHLEPNTRRISRFLSSISSRITMREHLDEFQRFTDSNKDLLKEVKQGVSQSLETAKLNVEWQEKHAAKISEVLKKVHKA